MSAKTPRAPRLSVSLTQEIIDESIPRDSSHCMIAEAIKAQYPDASRVAVDVQTVRFSDLKKGYRYTYLTPRVAQVAIVRFDQGIMPEPVSFLLRAGQVTRAGMQRPKRELSPKELKQRNAASKVAQESLQKARLVSAKGVGAKSSQGRVPDRIGGKTPPLTPFARRREFGLRGLER